MPHTSSLIPISVDDPSQVGHARRVAGAMADALGFDSTRVGELGIIVTEAARNIATHAGKGQIVLTPWTWSGRAGIDMHALDRGKGIADLARAREDGFSTAGTSGQGLGAMTRLASMLQMHSSVGSGTALFARVLRESGGHDLPAPAGVDDLYLVGAISLPIAGETMCGDAWSSSFTADRSIYIVADGLGHGPRAAEAAIEAVRVFHTMSSDTPEQILKEIHDALKKTRGAAIAIAEIRHRDAVLNYAGAGNISGAIYSEGKSRSMVSMNGTVGHSVSKLQQLAYPWAKNSMLIMHSDGLTTRWNVEQYSGLASRHPAMVAGVLYRDFTRGLDDVTVLVARR